MTIQSEFFSKLHEGGLRLTQQREMILAVISQMEGHVSARAILDEVRKRYPDLNKSVVYRTLHLFTERGILDLVDSGKGCLEYERHDHPHHHHLLCRRCGRSIEMDGEVLASFVKELEERYSFTPSLKHFAIPGYCRRCKAQSPQGGNGKEPHTT